MKNIIIKDNEYRLKKMNAIELLALRSQIDFSNYDTVKNLYNIILEKLEVNANDKWLPVKQTGREVYFPNGIENDFEVINDLLNYALDYFKEVFIKSSVSKKEQE